MPNTRRSENKIPSHFETLIEREEIERKNEKRVRNRIMEDSIHLLYTGYVLHGRRTEYLDFVNSMYKSMLLNRYKAIPSEKTNTKCRAMISNSVYKELYEMKNEQKSYSIRILDLALFMYFHLAS